MVYHGITAQYEIAAVLLEDPPSRRTLLRRRLRRFGPLHLAGQLLFQVLCIPVLDWWSRSRHAEIKARYGLNDQPIPPAKIHAVPSVNSGAAIAWLQAQQPDVVVINGTRILSAAVLESVPAPFLNVHAGITPAYRGVHGGYWAHARKDPHNCGVTVHLVDRGIDTGGILRQAPIHPTPADDFTTYPLLQLAAGIPLLRQCLADRSNGRLRLRPPATTGGHLFSHPTLWGYWYRRIFRGVR